MRIWYHFLILNLVSHLRSPNVGYNTVGVPFAICCSKMPFYLPFFSHFLKIFTRINSFSSLHSLNIDGFGHRVEKEKEQANEIKERLRKNVKGGGINEITS